METLNLNTESVVIDNKEEVLTEAMRPCNMIHSIENICNDEEAGVISFDEYVNYSKKPIVHSIPSAELYAFQMWLDLNLAEPVKRLVACSAFTHCIQNRLEITAPVFDRLYDITKETPLLETDNFSAFMAKLADEDKDYIIKATTDLYKGWYGGNTILNFAINNGEFEVGDYVFIAFPQGETEYGRVFWTAPKSPITYIGMATFGTIVDKCSVRKVRSEDLAPAKVELINKHYDKQVLAEEEYRGKYAVKIANKGKREAEELYKAKEMGAIYERFMENLDAVEIVVGDQAKALEILETSDVKLLREESLKIKLTKDLRAKVNTKLHELQDWTENREYNTNKPLAIELTEEALKAGTMKKLLVAREDIKKLKLRKEDRKAVNDKLLAKISELKAEEKALKESEKEKAEAVAGAVKVEKQVATEAPAKAEADEQAVAKLTKKDKKKAKNGK